MLSLLISAPAVLAVDELVRGEKQDAIAAAKAAFDVADTAFKEAKGKGDMPAKWDAYDAANKALQVNKDAIETKANALKDAEKAVADNKDDAKKDGLNKDVETAKEAKKKLEDTTADLKKKLDETRKEVSNLPDLNKALEIAQAKLDVANADLAHFDALDGLKEAEKAEKAIKIPTTEEYDKSVAAAKEAVKKADEAVTKAEAAAQGKAVDSVEAKNLEAAKLEATSATAKALKAEKVMPDALAAKAALKAAQEKVHGKEWIALEEKKEAVTKAEKALAENKDDALKDGLTKAVTAAKEIQKTAEEALKNSKVGTEIVLKAAQEKLAKVDPKSNFMVRFFRWGYNKVTGGAKAVVVDAPKNVWHTWVRPGYADNSFKKEGLEYKDSANKLTDFKAALTKQGVDYGTSYSRMRNHMLGLGALATVGTGLALKYVLGRSNQETAIGAAGAGTLTTILSALYLGYRHGVFSYGERRKDLIDKAKAAKLSREEALNAYNEVHGESTMKALGKFGVMGLWEMKSLAKQMEAAKVA